DRRQSEGPGNNRDLQSCMERWGAVASQNAIDVHDLPPAIRRLSEPPEAEIDPIPVKSSDLAELERETIRRVFEQTKGDKVLTGQMLGISRATLYRKLKRYNIGQPSQMGVAVGVPK